MKIEKIKLTEHVSCNKDDSIIEVAKRLKEHRIRHIIIVDECKCPIGIVASVDIVNKIIAEGKEYKNLKAKDIMINPLFYVKEEDEIMKAYIGMAKRNIFSCPVVSGTNEFKGMLTFTETIKHLSRGGNNVA